jgi:hypothetical protein
MAPPYHWGYDFIKLKIALPLCQKVAMHTVCLKFSGRVVLEKKMLKDSPYTFAC